MFAKSNPLIPESLYRQAPQSGYRPNQPYTVDGFEFLPMAEKQAKLAEIKNKAQSFTSQNFSRGSAQGDYQDNPYLSAGQSQPQSNPFTMSAENSAPTRSPFDTSAEQSNPYLSGGMIDPRMTEQPKPKKPGFFGKGGTAWDILGALGDGLTGNPVYGNMQQQERQSLMQQEQARQKAMDEQRQRMDDRQYDQGEWDRRRQVEIDNPKPVQPTEFERLLSASGLTPEQQTALMGQYVQNRANPVQGVPYTDEQGNTGIQFIRPNQQAPQSMPTPGTVMADPRLKGGPASQSPGNFPQPTTR